MPSDLPSLIAAVGEPSFEFDKMIFVPWFLCTILIFPSEIRAEEVFLNQIAVKIQGGPEKAKEIAKRHACEYQGQVGHSETFSTWKVERNVYHPADRKFARSLSFRTWKDSEAFID